MNLGQVQNLFGNAEFDPNLHVSIFGGTGSGKSTLLLRFFDSFVDSGVALFDPNGDLVDQAIERIPKPRLHHTLLIDPLSEKPIGFNPLQGANPELCVEQSLSILANFYGSSSWLARADYISRNLALAVIHVIPNATLFHVLKALVDDDYRAYLRSKAPERLEMFFIAYDENWPEREREAAAASPLNKFDLLNKPFIRAMLGQPKGLDLRRVMDEGKIVFLKFSKGILGEETTALLSAIFTAGFANAALGRADTKVRRPFKVIADEFQNNFRGTAHETILAEARKYGLTYILATQTTAQLPDGALPSILGNTPNKICFYLSPKDAEALAPAIGVPPETLVNLNRGECYARLLRDGLSSSPLRVQTFLVEKKKDVATKDQVIRYTLSNYGKPREKVEQELNELLGG